MTNMSHQLNIIHLIHDVRADRAVETPKGAIVMAEIPILSVSAANSRLITTLCEVAGSVLAMIYAIAIALNIGFEVIGFTLLLVSSALFAGWAFLDKRWTFLLLQLFYASSAIIGIFRWG